MPLDVGLCERCNPLGLKDSPRPRSTARSSSPCFSPSSDWRVIARLALTGVGPFPATVVSAVPVADSLEVTARRHERGQQRRPDDVPRERSADRVGGESAFLLSPRIEPGQTVTFTKTVTVLGTEAGALDVTCRAP